MDQSALPPLVPGTRNPIGKAIGRLSMWLTGWRFEGMFPDIPRFVAVFAPHTSNWDFFAAFQAKLAIGVRATWVGKHTLFRWPTGVFLRSIGGMPVDRSAPHGVVQTIVAEFAAREQMVFVLAPEGTRRRVEHWRSGYWRVARGAGVPIIPIGLDYARRIVAIGPPVQPTESLVKDERRLREFLAGVHPRVPENYVP